MPRIDRTPEAQQDIDEIVDFIAEDNEAAARRWLDGLNRELDLLSRFPRMGPLREELAPGLRSLPFGNYVILYFALRDGLIVARVFHGARDIEHEFE
jgi:toxin ParE1/3/4